MNINLDHLRKMHPLLPLTTALEYAFRAAVGLGRHGHASGVSIELLLDQHSINGTLQWEDSGQSGTEQTDFHRTTEDAAEAIALAAVHVANSWTVRRRLQRGEAADWLLLDPERHIIALEISGVNGEDARGQRLKDKIKQVTKCPIPGAKAACVVELKPPGLRMKTV